MASAERSDVQQGSRVRLTAHQREQQILDVAEVLFSERGLEGVSLEDIARAAGVTRPIVYQHHGSRDGVFLACVRRAREELHESIVERLASAGPDLADRIVAGGEPYFDLIKSGPQRWVLLFATSSSLGGEVANQLGALREQTIAVIAQEVRSLDLGVASEQSTVFAYAISGIGEQLGRWWLRHPRVPKKRVLNYYRVLILGAATAGLAEVGTAVERGR